MIYCLILGRFLIDLEVKNPPKIYQKSIPKGIENKMQVGMMIMDGSWIDFWSILSSSWGSSWDQVGTQIRKIGVPRRGQKIIKNLETQGYAVIRGGPQWSEVLAPKESLRDTRIIEYKRQAIGPRNTPLSGRWPGGGYLQATASAADPFPTLDDPMN